MRNHVVPSSLVLFASLGMGSLIKHQALPALSSTISARAPLSTGTSSKCGKGYTYCGYMLQSDGHSKFPSSLSVSHTRVLTDADFSPDVINKTYCDGLQSYCPNNNPKTSPNQAVFICMNDAPASIELLCACSGKCLDEPASNNIAHCDSACASPQKGCSA
ncbi:hypothetical protein PG993_014212 [Apiospora rasikravindrae]|uniref:Uncharacterized protein n=1 Tax=Apiospora rasikravindrae TaxID=990691 RepID=A0ABR1RTI8_9PEZI